MGGRRRVGRRRARARQLEAALVVRGVFAHAAAFAPLPIHPTPLLQALGDRQLMHPTGHTRPVQGTFHQ
jgi:hypothetical protein